eukprot:8985697-Heterocapsa_arctica.AAC.1
MENQENTKQNHIDNDGEHKGSLAENINFNGGNPVMDTNALGKAKLEHKALRHANVRKCEPDKLGGRPKNDMHNFNKWKYNKKKGTYGSREMGWTML